MLTAARELTAAHAEALAVQADLAAEATTGAAGAGGDPALGRGRESLTARVAALGAHTAQARGATDDPLWRAASLLPYAGRSLVAVRAIAVAGDTVARGGLADLAASVAVLRPAREGAVRDGLPMPALQRLATSLQRTSDATDAAARTLAAAQPEHLVAPVADARTQLLDALGSAQRRLQPAARVAELSPGLLGAEGPRTYVVGFVNPAEARGGGGLLGGFAVVRADHGRLRVLRIGSDTDLHPLRTPPRGLPGELVADYGMFGATTDWAQSNMSANFPYTGRLWSGMYASLTGTHIDASLSLDPAALSVLLRGAAPIDVGGGARVTSANVVGFLQRGEYALPLTPDQRKSVLRTVARAAVHQITARPASALVDLLGPLRAAAGEGHVRLWSAAPREQALLATYPVGGQLPGGAGPFLSAYVNNAASGKLDDYLAVRTTYVIRSCPVAGSRAPRRVEVRVELRNTAPRRGLPAYVTVRGDGVGADGRSVPAPGSNRSLVSVVLTRGAQVQAAVLDGVDLASASGGNAPSLTETTERGHPVESIFVGTDPGRSATLVLQVDEPAAAPSGTAAPDGGAPVLLAQPMSIPQRLDVAGRCGTP